ncbi:MAG: autotransporter-associated beta strand repeat-containing protein [Agitococcus sp.]
MRRPPFTVRPLALSVTLAIATPVAVAADIAASAVASPQEVNNVVLTASDNVISVATEVTGIIKEQNDTNSTQLIKQGAGTLSLTNNNTYKGGTDVQAGTLSVARAASLGDGAVNLAGGSTLETQSSTTLTQNILLKGDATISTGGIKPAENITQVTSTISGDGGLIKSGAGTLSLTNNNTYKGGTDVQAGTLSVARAASLGDGAVNLADGSTLETQSSTTLTQDITLDGNATIKMGGQNAAQNITQITSAITEKDQKNGNSSLTKSGAGTLSLTNNNTYKGGTDVQAGTLSVARAASLGDGAVTLQTGSTLDTQASTTITQNVTLSGDATISTTGAENITQITSKIDGAGSLTKNGAGTLSLTADNGYLGNTTINQGTLAISRNDSLGTGTLVTINGATLKTNQDVNVGQDVTIIGQGKIDTGGKNSILSGMVTGGTLEKTGNGSLTLNDEANNQSNTILNGGILIIDDKDKDNVSTLGTGNLEIKKGTLQTSSDMVLNNKITTTSSAGGSINTNGHEVTLNGQVTGVGRLVKTGGGTLTLNTTNDYNLGIVTDSSGVKSAIVGNTVINGGVLAISADAQLGKAAEKLDGSDTDDKNTYKWQLGNVLVDGGTLQTTQSLTSDRHIYVGAAGATVNVNGAANTTVLAGAIKNDGTVGGGLVKEGAGTLKVDLNFKNYLKSDDSFGITANDSIGTITVKEGVLEVFDTGKDLGGAANLVLAGGEFRVSNSSNIGFVTLQGTGGTLDTTGATIRTAKITGDGSLQKQGSGTLVLTGLANDYKGDTTISGGKVQINSAQGLGDANTGTLVLDGGSLQVVGNTEVTLNKNAVITSNNGTVDNVSSNVTLSGVVSGAGQLVKSGAGKFSLTNENNNFEGGVRIKDGTLEVSTDGSLGKANTQVLIDGATLAIAKDANLSRQIVFTEKGGAVSVAGTNTATLSGTLSLDAGVLSADFTKSGTGTLNLTKDNTNFKGNTIIQEGTLGITGKDNLAQGKLFLDGGNLRTNASLNFDKEIIINSTGGIDTSLDALGNKTEVTVISKIQGNGGLVKTGEGTLTLSADNAYAGGTQVKGGTLVVNKDANLGLSATDIELDGGTLKLTNADAVDFKTTSIKKDGKYPDARVLAVGSAGGSLDISGLEIAIETEISGKGTLTQKGNKDSVLTLTANNTLLEGGITVENGTLKIQDNTNLGALAATLTLKDGTTLDTTNANADLVLDRSLTLGDGKVTLKQDENLTIERGLVGSDKANLVVNTGTKTLALNGNNSAFAGNLLVEGNIEVKQNLGIGTVEFNKGVESANATDSSVHVTANATFNNKFELNGQTTINTDKDTKSNFNAVIKNAEYTEKDSANNDVTKFRTGSLVKAGEGEVILNTKNTYSGGTKIEKGTVTVGDNEALGTGQVILADGTTLKNTQTVSLANQIQVGGTTGTATGAVTISTVSNSQMTLTNAVTGDAGITKTGIGTLVLNGVNTYKGQTLIQEGTMEINSAAALGTHSDLSLSAGATLKTTAEMKETAEKDGRLSKNILLVGQAGSQATINTTGGDVVLSGKLQNDAANQAGIIKEGVSTLTLSGDNSTYQGKTTIKEGYIAISEAKNLGGKVDVELAGGGLTLLSNLTVGANANDAINITGVKGEINTAAGTTSELGVAFKGTGKFVKQGDGKLILSGDNKDFTGGVSVDKGILAITQDVSLGKTNTDVVLNGGTLQADGLTTLARDVQLNQNSTINNISANSMVELNRLKGNFEVTLEGGTFNLASDGVHTNQHNGTILKNTTVSVKADSDLGQSAGKLTFDGNATLDVQSQLSSTRNVVINNASNILDTNTHLVSLGELAGKGSISKSGTGDLILNQNSQNYSGTTTINEASVIVGADKALGTGQTVLNKGTILKTNVAVNLDNKIEANQQVTLDSMDKDSSLNGVISGTNATISKAGSGTLSLNGTNTFTGNVAVTEGKVAINNANSLGANNNSVSLADNTSLITSAAVTAQQAIAATGKVTLDSMDKDSSLNGVISGTNATISKAGSGTLSLNGTNTFTGNVAVTEGKVAINNANSLGANNNSVSLADNTSLITSAAVTAQQAIAATGKVTLDSMDKDSSLNGVISGTNATISKAGSGTLSLNGTNTFTGNVAVTEGKVAINNANSLGANNNSVSLADNTSLITSAAVTAQQAIAATGKVTLDSMDKDSSLNGVISGTNATISKAGSGTLSLNGTNTFTGNVAVTEGKVAINNANSLGANNNSVSLADNTSLITSAAVTAQQAIAATGKVTLDSMDKDSSLNGVISGTNATISKAGSGTLSLNGTNTFTGNVAVTEGKVAINNANSLGANNNSVSLADNTSLITSAAVTAQQAIAATGKVTLDSMDKDSSLNGVISGTNATISKAGSGTLSLNGTNTFTGNVAVTEGKVAINNANSLGANNNSVSLADNTSLITSAAVTAQQAIAATGKVTLDSMDKDSSLNGVISGTNATISKAGSGTLSLNGTNTFTGNVAVTEGKVAINNANSLGANNNSVSLADNTSLITSAAVTAQQAIAATGKVTLDSMDKDSSLNGVISGTNATISKAGSGTLSLNGTNTFTGNVAVTEGKVAINNANSLGANNNSVSLADNTSLITSAAVTAQQAIAATGKVTLDSMDKDSSLNGVISGTNATISKAGSGTLSLNGTNTFTGNVAVTEGKVAINNANSLGANNNSVSLADNTSLITSAAVTAQQAIAATGKVTLDSMDKDSSLNGVISGTNATISKAGSGTLSLNGSNTFVGSLNVQSGKVAINNANSLGANNNSVSLADNTSLITSAAVTAQQAIAATGKVTLDSMANDSTLSGVVSGNAAISKAGTGKLTLAGANTVVGDVTVNAGSLALANAQALGATSNKVVLNQAALIAAINNLTVNNQIEINNSATIDTGVNTLNINSAISGGTLSKTGSGTLVLAGANTQSATVVNQGKIKVANNSALGVTDANVTLNGATFESSGTQTYARNFVLGNTGGIFNTLQSTTVTLSNTVSGDGALTKTDTGTLVLAGANAYKGSTNVSAGKLVVSQANNLGQTTNINLGTATLETKADMSLQNVVLSGTGTILTDNKLTIAGVVSGAGALVKQGSGSLELSSENTYSGGTTLEAGTLTLANSKSIGTGNLVVKSGQVVLKDGFVSTQALIQNAESSSDITGKGTFSNAEVNSGMLTINGDITTTTNTTIKNNSTLFVNGSLSSLNTIIDNGTLFINGSLTSPITVGSRAKLAGRGTITGNVAVNGLLSPGNSPAILTINGDVDQKEGSSLLVEIDGATAGSGAGHHDQVVSSGNYNIAASNTVLEAKLRGITGDATNSFVPSIGQSFDVVKAKAVNGAFATYKQPTEGLAAGTRLDIGYTANSIRLYVTPVTYTSVASGENATGAAKFLDNVLVLKDTDIEVAQIYNAILPANSQQLQAAMINMSPALYAESAQSVLALQQKLHNSQTISETFKQGGLALRGFQQDTDVDSDGNGLAATRSISGVQLSVDSEPYANDWQMGAAVSIVNKADVESNSSALKLSGHDVALTVRKKVSDWMLGATVDMGNYTFDTNRNINIVGTQFKTNQQDVKTSSYGVGVQASRNYGSWTLATGLRYNNVKQDGFVEQGNSLLALKVADVEQDQVVAMLGGAWQNTWKTQMWNIVPKLSLDLEQVVAGDTAQAEAMLGAGQVTATASDAGKTLFRAGVGVNFVNKDGITIGVDASTEQADNLSANTGRLTFSKSF